ncbi:reverse transcriptase-RNase H-integrase [Favolaschia claudopus]|uniref:Reverse transcriptase-RNase H-integrase n=1 Tax=Favolaschia claudopus TaxID=2862362 RepID=A0AAV9ZQ02_9AGAR
MDQPRERAAQLLRDLKAAIEAMPPGMKSGQRDGDLARYLTPKLSKDDPPVEIFPSDGDGAYSCFSTQWERVFQSKSSTEPLDAKFHLVCRGSKGLILAYTWAEHYVMLETMTDGDIEMIIPRLESLLVLISSAIKAHNETVKRRPPPSSPEPEPSDDEFPAAIAGTKRKESTKSGKQKDGKAPVKKKTKKTTVPPPANGTEQPSDPNAKKRKSPAHPETPQSDAESAPPKPAKKSKQSVPSDQSSDSEVEVQPAQPKAKAKTKVSVPRPVSDDEDEGPAKIGNKLQWALLHFRTPKATTKNDEPVWTLTCRHCSNHRTTPRTEGITEYENETLKIKTPSNFTNHAEKCTHRPTAQSFEKYQESADRVRRGLPALPESVASSSQDPQREMMQGFIQRGIDNPAKSVTQRTYRQHLVQAIVQDDLAFRLTENEGIYKLLVHILPAKIKARVSHQTVARDLAVLHQALDKKLETMIKMNESKISIATDIATTKNMVNAFCGVTVFFIDQNWVLQEHVLDLIPLDGDHSGEAVAKLVYASLARRKVDALLFSCGSDNASCNGTMCRGLVRFCIRGNPLVGSARNMQIGCGGHVTNLVAQTVTGTLGIAPPIAKKDLYEETRKFPLVYDPNDDPVVVAEMEEMEKDLKAGCLEKDVQEADLSGSDLSDDDDNSHENIWVDENDAEADEIEIEKGAVGEKDTNPQMDVVVEPASSTEQAKRKGGKEKKKKAEKVFTAIDKIHESVVHILRSEIRRKKARVLTHKLVDEDYRHLVFVRSMVVRWNTIYAELNRARHLSPALDAFVADLARGLTGKPKTIALARKKKWEMHSEDWEFVDKLINALEVLQDVTLEFSKKGVPTICKVLPLYMLMQTRLAALADDYMFEEDALSHALRAGSEKAEQYVGKALISDYPLLGAVLHPAIRLAFFESDDWAPEVPRRARRLLADLAKKHSDSTPSTSTQAAASTKKKGIFAQALQANSDTQKKTVFSGNEEVKLYLSCLGNPDVIA